MSNVGQKQTSEDFCECAPAVTPATSLSRAARAPLARSPVYNTPAGLQTHRVALGTHEHEDCSPRTIQVTQGARCAGEPRGEKDRHRRGMEVKAPGKGADPRKFTNAHDKYQLQKFKALPRASRESVSPIDGLTAPDRSEERRV